MYLAFTYLVKPTLGENSTQAEIKAALTRKCTDPEPDLKECQLFRQEHRDQTQMIQIVQTPPAGQEAGACPFVSSAAAEEHSGCSSGPSYLCKSLDNAKECEAVSRCLEHVWH
ncbi:Hypothetical predicted protein [Pelobates cultripes]|uniref:Saposin A-type domain-containing protein n=1 Tax=Pelobates cultripes TaxID=61616 RepID=A0AAD1TK00_PELCU|nr:Hypothetical predicted protein [Pelobates cultripes]